MDSSSSEFGHIHCLHIGINNRMANSVGPDASILIWIYEGPAKSFVTGFGLLQC